MARLTPEQRAAYDKLKADPKAETTRVYLLGLLDDLDAEAAAKAAEDAAKQPKDDSLLGVIGL